MAVPTTLFKRKPADRFLPKCQLRFWPVLWLRGLSRQCLSDSTDSCPAEHHGLSDLPNRWTLDESLYNGLPGLERDMSCRVLARWLQWYMAVIVCSKIQWAGGEIVLNEFRRALVNL